MKFALSLGLAALALAAPTPTIEQLASVSDTPAGYASQNGGYALLVVPQ